MWNALVKDHLKILTMADDGMNKFLKFCIFCVFHIIFGCNEELFDRVSNGS